MRKIWWFVSGGQINQLPKPKTKTNNLSARHLQITISLAIAELLFYHSINCFIIFIPLLFSDTLWQLRGSYLSFSHRNVVTKTREPNNICSKTHLDVFMLEQSIICRQLFTGHVVVSWQMNEKKNMGRMNDDITYLHYILHNTHTYISHCTSIKQFRIKPWYNSKLINTQFKQTHVFTASDCIFFRDCVTLSRRHCMSTERNNFRSAATQSLPICLPSIHLSYSSLIQKHPLKFFSYFPLMLYVSAKRRSRSYLDLIFVSVLIIIQDLIFYFPITCTRTWKPVHLSLYIHSKDSKGIIGRVRKKWKIDSELSRKKNIL